MSPAAQIAALSVRRCSSTTTPPVLDREPGGLGELGPRLRADADDDDVRGESGPVVENGDEVVVLGLDALGPAVGDELDAVLGEHARVSPGEVGREALLGEEPAGVDEGHLRHSGARERGRELLPDVAAAEDDDAGLWRGEAAQRAVVLQGAEEDDALVVGGPDAHGVGAGGEEEPAVGDAGAAGELDLGGLRVDRDDRSARRDLCAGVLRGVHHVVLDGEVGVDPELLGQGGARVGLVGVGREDADGAGGVELADGAGRVVAHLPAADDEVVVLLRVSSFCAGGTRFPAPG